MRFVTALVVAAIGLADATPVKNPICPLIVKLVSKPAVSAQAEKFCTSVLGITTATTTVTPTVTPRPVTTVVTDTTTAATVTKTLTEFQTDVSITTSTTVLARRTVTETSTSTSLTTLSCFTSSTVLTSYLLPAETMKKRHQRQPLPTPDCFRNMKLEAVKSACNCLCLKRPTSTVTSPVTVPARTTTSTFFVTQSPSTQTTATVIVTSVSTTVTTVSPVAKTETATVTLVIETPALNGLQYYVYNNPHDYNLAGPGPNPADFQGGGYTLSGVIQDVDTVNSVDGVSTFPDGEANGANIAAKFQGFFYARTAGEYTFSTPNTIDNQLTVWTGDIAYGQQTWTYGNAAYDALRSGGDASEFRGGSVTLTLRAGEVVPVTMIWGNSSDVGVLYFWVSTPEGTTVWSTTSLFTTQCPGGPFTRPS